MFDAGNLITLGVVLVVLIAFRILDKDNRSLEKIKKYTDKLKEELDAVAAERAEALKSYAVEVDSHKKAAKEVLRQVQEAETNLAARAEGIASVAQRIAEYDKALAELKAMSQRVDQNLHIIHEESDFVDGLAKEIRNTRADIDQLNQEIPLLRTAAYEESLASGQQLQARFQADLTAATVQAEAQNGRIKQELDAAFVRAHAEAQKLEAASFQQLRAQIEQRVAALTTLQAEGSRQAQDAMAKQEQASRQQTEAAAAKLRQELNGRMAEIIQLADGNDEKLTGLVTKRFDDIQKFADNRSTALESLVNQRLDQIEDQTGLRADKLTAAIGGRLDALDQLAGSRSAKLEEAIETRFSSLREQAKEKVAETQGLLKGFKQDWRKEAEELLEQSRQAAMACQSQLEPLLKDTRQALDKAETGWTERLQQLETKSTESAQALLVKLKDNLKEHQEELTKKHLDTKTDLQLLFKQQREAAQALADETTRSLAEANARLSAGRQAQDSQLAAISEQLQTAERQARQTIDALNDKFTQRGADLENRVLAGFEQRADSLRALVEQGLERLEASRLDINQLEKGLRGSMAGVEKRVEADFSLFAQDVVGRHEAFEAKMAAEAGKLHHAMKALDEDLQTLKGNAYDNVSAQLKIFEDEFFADLKKRREDADQKLQTWRSSLDEHLTNALHGADSERAEAERAWLDEARQRAAAIQQQVGDALDKLAGQVDRHRQSITERVSEADTALVQLKDAVRTDLEEARDAANALLKAELARWQQSGNEQIQQAEQKAALETKRLAELLKESKSLFDSGRSDLNQQLQTFSHDFAHKMEESQQIKQAAIETLGASFNNSVQALDKEWKTQREKLVEGSKAERETIAREVRRLSDELDRLRTDLGQRGAQALDDFKREWETAQQAASRKLQETEGAIQASVEEYRQEEKNLQSVFLNSRDKLQKGLDEERREREKIFAEIDKQVKAFQTQTRLFERADELKQQLADSVESLKADMARADSRRAEMAELETQYGRIKRAEDEVGQKVTRFMAEKRRIDSMEEDFKRLLGLSQAVDQKLATVTANHDQLTQLQADMRRLMDAAGEANEKYERVEKKSSILDATADAIDKNFQAISELERNLRGLDADIKDFPDRVIQLKRSIQEVSAVQPQIDASLERLESMGQLMVDAEKRAAELQKAREWLARAETRFEELNKKTNDHLKLLNDLLKDDPGPRKDKSGAPPLSVQESVRKLAHQGWKTDEIARAVKLSRGEVELILELSNDK
ncbi:MAG: hypothetical protein A2087_12300 [Spirochaetes bacterium GWD1_61_31]|nr:MAG: hypothetical protein A2Y37_07245 [Spirochaetes bacterium GWB1_60_80]OHD34015.1 MAG: hypothetical protein A2004_02175 [Spirochaetes bacterium GWC1_61_12]OHD35190.1 MAG: hypothetical protein A2087_12300 [Spirochaetes bacterium GWD1_61_31]OHD41395.1 MAG: hypothetical protein A2Y35_05490 [Spirochaetes bacterium GWE1_60_18]OHD59192.1 MAG: hypothetical protein A2Y32_00205 [Spirochaetes bacterium GWF1_60_12]HAP43108.1 hypothetical protein [Spirochaetaceae bacterium]